MSDVQQSKLLLLTNKTVLITGAAKGIGRGIAIEMAREGADVVIADIDEEESQKTIRLIRDLERSCLAVPTDVRDIEQNNRLVDRVLETYGKIDILVNNAGLNTPEVDRVLEVSPETFDYVLSTNFRGHLHFIPLGYSGAPEDIAHAMVFMASEKASYITGQTLTVDGGFSIAHTHYWRLLGMLPDNLSKKGGE